LANCRLQMSLRGNVFIVFVFLVIRIQSYAQLVTNVKHYSTADGLSDNRVTDITKDSEGFMWFGSWAGLSRFDGYNFLTFKSYPGDRSSLKSNRIDEIVEDSQGRYLWIRAYDKQVYRFDKRTQDFTSLTDLLKDASLGKIAFLKILSIKNGRVWLKTEGHGVLMIANSAASKPTFFIFSNGQQAPYKIASNAINFFHIDRLTNVWLGTAAGLSVLSTDAAGLYKARTTGILSRKAFTAVAETKKYLCLSTGKGELVFTNHTFKDVRTYTISPVGLNHTIASKKSENLYCTTPVGELIAVAPNGMAEVLFKTNNKSPLYYMYEDSSGVLWIESENFGVIRFDPRLKKPEYLFPQKEYAFNPKIRALTVFEDKNATVWIRLRGQLSFYNSARKSIEPLSVERANYSPKLPKTIIRFFYDPAGVLWLGSGFDGINKLTFQEHDFRQHAIYPGSSSSADNEVRGITAGRNNRLWLGTKSGELLVYENGRRIPTPVQGKLINEAGIYSILEDSKGRLWMGTKANGLIKASPRDSKGGAYSVTQYFANKGQPAALSNNSIYCILEDRKGRVWAGTFDEGLVLIEENGGKTTFKTTQNSFRNYPKGGFLKIRHLAEDAEGRIWVGTTGGLLIFNPDAGRAENYVFSQYRKEPGDIHSLGGNDIQFIFRDSQKQMWVLTTTGGVNLAQGDNPLKALSFTNYSSKDGLPSDFLLSCAEDSKRNLWVATQNGLAKFSIDKRTFQNFNYNDGLQDLSFSEASCTKLKGGELVFGNTGGYLEFNPEKIFTKKISAPMALTNLQINSKDIAPNENSPLNHSINNTEEVELKYDQNVISIDFAVLDFHSSDKLNYASRLVGFDNVWRNTEGQRRATYTKLPPGEYTFEVKSLNGELYKQIPFRSLRITILPPPWKTWWAYTIYLIVLLIAFSFVRRLAATMLKLKQGIEVERRLADLKLSFFTQISHELRTPLTLIVNPSEEILEHESLSDKGKEYINVVIKNARRMLRMVNQVLDLRKVQSGKASLQPVDLELISFIKSSFDYFKEVTTHKNLRLEINSNLPDLQVWVDAEKLEIVIYNLLANAIKFSPDNSTIYVNVNKNDASGYFRIEVADEGPGVDEMELQDIFKLYYEGKQGSGKHVKGTGIGLALTKELVELHGGKVYAEPNLPTGLRVIVELKLGREHYGTVNQGVADDIQHGIENNLLADNLTEGITFSQDSGTDNLPLVLIVEDNDDLRNFLASKFSGLYRVETARDGAEGFEKATIELPDLVLSDIMMPKLDGIQLLDKLKNCPETSHIPVVLLTAKYSIESQIEGLKYGADYYITKPFDLKLLQTAINSVIKRRKTAFQQLQNREEVSTATAGITEYDQQFLEKIVQIVESKLNDAQFNIDDVADSIGMSRSTFYRKFKSLTGTPPVEFVRETRLRKGKELLDAGEDNVSIVAYTVGFNNPKYFSSCFKAQYQQTPSEYVKAIKEARRR